MSSKSAKFGTFKGVFTPSILSILGVIMFLRLPWIVGEAGLYATIAIILVAHFISITTGLSIASIATDKKVEKGGMYYMISRSMGLPIGGTLGLAFFVGLSFSVSLYLIGFSEVFLTALGFEITKDLIRITGAAALLVVTILTFISTNLALKTQIFILLIIILSLVSIFFGQHEYIPKESVSGFAKDSFPWIALFAIFFPAVTGFGTGASMSGDLRDPKKSIPIGTIGAIIAGLIVYAGLTIFLSFTVDRQLLKDDSVLLNISLYAPLVIAGIWSATLSSALGSILGAPRILQATAIDKITPKIFAKGFGEANEPRNALIMTFAIALGGILIGDLNIIARLVTIFFIITYGFLNLTCAIENWAGSDFRPSFRIPVIVSILGSIACFFVMIQLDLLAMIVATLILISVFLFIKSKELHLQSGDTWNGFYSSLVKFGLRKLSAKGGLDKRNWRPNIILFSGTAKSRPHLVEIARSMVGKMGVFTNFELVESPSEEVLFDKQAKLITETDHQGKTILTRRHTCSDIYQGMDMICRVYGFTGFEPNTILLGWSGKTKNPEKYVSGLKNFIRLNYNLAILSFDQNKGFGKKKLIDLWWPGHGRELQYGLTLLKFITSDPAWRSAKLRIFIINYESSLTEKIYDLTNQMLDNSRLTGTVKIINNNVEKTAEYDIVKNESENSDLTILTIENSDLSDSSTLTKISKTVNQLKTTLLIKASDEFDEINVFTDKEKYLSRGTIEQKVPDAPVIEKLKFPRKEILVNEIINLSAKFQNIHTEFLKNSFGQATHIFEKYLDEFKETPKKAFLQLEKTIEHGEQHIIKNSIDKQINDFAYKAQNQLLELKNEVIPIVKNHLTNALNEYIKKIEHNVSVLPEKVIVAFDSLEFTINRDDKFRIKCFKLRKRFNAWFLRRRIKQKAELRRAAKLFLLNRRFEALNNTNNEFRIYSYKMVSSLKNYFSDILETLEKIQRNIDDKQKAIEIIHNESKLLINKQDDIFKESKNTFNKISNILYSDLFINLQKISYILDNPVGNFKLKLYNRTLIKNNQYIEKIQKMPEIWLSNIDLYVSKSNLEFLLINFKKRIKTKLNKKVSELNILLETNILQNLKKLKEQVKSSGDINKLTKTDSLRLLLKEKQKRIDLNEYFEIFFTEMHELIAKLPETTVINDDILIQQIEKGILELSDTKIINVRSNVEFYIGTELINNARIELDNLTSKLNEVSHNIQDIIRLMLFNIENIDIKSKASSSDIKETESLFCEIKERIETEEKRFRQLTHLAHDNFNKHLESAFENINIIALTHKTEPSKLKRKQKQENSIKVFLRENSENFMSFYRNQMVKVIYTKSESVKIAHKLTEFEKEHKINNQAIHEILDSLVPDKNIIKQIPYYYLSLFSVSSIINMDLWVGMQKQLQEANKSYKRFKNGYSGGLLITGERNSGKTSLAKIIANKILPDYQIHFIKAPKGEIPSDGILDKYLKESFDTKENIMDYLVTRTEKRVIIFDDLELWWYRTKEGDKYINKIFDFINSFADKYFFIVICKTYAFNFINTLYNLDSYFLGHAECEPLGARELKEMILLRHKAGGLKFKLNKKNEDDFSEWDYAKLFNKYFELTFGNPGQTSKAWIANIKSIKGKIIEIKTPEKPSIQHLQNISDDIWIIILQFILHRRLNTEKLTNVLRIPANKVRIMLSDLQRAGIVEERFEGIYAINSYLEPILIKNLKNKNML